LIDIRDAIDNERDYQDEKYGTVEEHPHSILEWIRIMANEIKKAEDTWLHGGRDEAMLEEIVQAIAVGHACLEQHGVVAGHP
jgi:hypothetical protein